MIVSWIRTTGFRNLIPATIRLEKGVNIFVGSNAQGKTNVLEAVALLANGRSFRGAGIADMIRSGETDAGIEGLIFDGNTETTLKIHMSRSLRQYHLNDRPVSDLREFLGCFSYVVFAAECMAIVEGDSAARRSFLDHGYFGLKPSYLLTLRSYRKTIKSRNATIKQAPDNEALIEAWNDSLCRNGAAITHARMTYLEKIRQAAENEYHHLAGGKEQLTIEYYAPWLRKEAQDKNDEKHIYEDLRNGLEKSLASDIRRGSTTVGPHRDDMRILIDGKNIRWYGSRGQKRSVLLALKLAELEIFHSEKNQYPILILDDISSELDKQRRDSLIRSLPENIQILISHTEKFGFDRPAQYFNVTAGNVTKC